MVVLACCITFWRYVTFACPDLLGGDGVVFACTAHARTFFWLQIYPAVIVRLGAQDLSFMLLLFQKKEQKPWQAHGTYRPVRNCSGLLIFIRDKEELIWVQLNRLLYLLAEPLLFPRSGGVRLSWGDSPVVLDWLLMSFKFLTV